ncbi:MAG: GNAT family N-acetyltransferase [Candidatus Moranbacteria bacterium]|nr:GNAT family N-acetyltransferase [Candidatus Moranbacteria bacterium]
MNDIKIREAAFEDLEDIRRLNLELFKKEYADFDKSLDLKWSQSASGEEYFADRIVSSDGLVCVAEEDGKVVGYLCGGLCDRGYRTPGIYAELENMFVDEKHRRLGIGKKLADSFLQWCDENNVKYINVTASAKNADTIGFYRSLGFCDYDVKLQIER